MPLGAWIGPGWSVSVEMAAYLALPAVLRLMRRLSSERAALWLAVTCLAAFVGLLPVHGEHDPNVTVKGGFVRLAFEFVAGAAIHEAWQRGIPIRSDSATAVIASLPTMALAIPVREATFLALPAFAILLAIAAQGEGVACRVLASGAARFLGQVSYSLYLVHWPVLISWRHFGGFALPLEVNRLSMAATIALAAALHRLVEVPSHRWAHRIGRKEMPPRAEAAAQSALPAPSS